MTSSGSSNISTGLDGSGSDRSSPDVMWLGTTFGSGLSPHGFRLRQSFFDILGLPPALPTPEAVNHVDPRLRTNGTPENHGIGERSPSPAREVNISPRAQREIERQEEYNRTRKSREALRRIIKTVQDKRREEFRVLRQALYQIYHYDGPFLKKPGEKAAAGRLIRTGGLASEFVNVFDDQAKWEYLQMRVDAI
ncbi:uncharacterized protein MELLADRAFT_61005 [Melampsora larici-populina 98AG31]|uniref:Uncharacterized protein n=1 Tax=Melampsora larici-populina (strain 98AG31 / pathotype 3-4-7) TaxID=747676 RepID=F4RD82_MELLP|nr:uncharacterized protein MELLADRAFT_61005 [Melampsora larici-populina 98AG31]EGG09355.1 hypothetical protein MELLADRAFT_61005 [Melampsora larici-populina 98AG31]